MKNMAVLNDSELKTVTLYEDDRPRSKTSKKMVR